MCCLRSRATTRRALDERIFSQRAHTRRRDGRLLFIVVCGHRMKLHSFQFLCGAQVPLSPDSASLSFEPLLSCVRESVRLFSIKVMNRVRPSERERDD